MEPPFPIQALGVNPFPSRFINRTAASGDFPRWSRKEIMTRNSVSRAAPAFDNLFMGCVFNINTVHKTVEN